MIVCVKVSKWRWSGTRLGAKCLDFLGGIAQMRGDYTVYYKIEGSPENQFHTLF